MSPLISIVVPSYNSSRYLPDMIRSIELQTYKKIQVILSDGASDDETVSLIRASSLENVIIDSRPDKGVPDALNRGFALATGDLFCWLNSDDFYVSTRALQSVAEAYTSRQVDYLFGHTVLTDELGVIQKELFAHKPVRKRTLDGNNMITGSLFFSPKIWSEFTGFSDKNKFAFEYELKRFLALGEYESSLVNCFISGFRVHSEGLTTKEKENIARETAAIYADWRFRPLIIRKFERIYSLIVQGTFFSALRAATISPRVGRHWLDYLESAEQ